MLKFISDFSFILQAVMMVVIWFHILLHISLGACTRKNLSVKQSTHYKYIHSPSLSIHLAIYLIIVNNLSLSLVLCIPIYQMAQSMKLFFVVVAIIAAVGAAQELAPAPSPDAGSGFSLPVSTAFVATSLLFSLQALSNYM